MIPTITYQGQKYPKFQTEGFAAKFAFPYALQVCKGEGYDIGCNRMEWKFPGAHPIDPAIDYKTTPIARYLPDMLKEQWEDIVAHHTAMDLPKKQVDYIFSSHCLEHLPNWVDALEYWKTKLKPGGTLFLYLPDFSQAYWRPWNNRKHIHSFTPKLICSYLEQVGGWCNVKVSGVDLNNSFMAMAEKV